MIFCSLERVRIKETGRRRLLIEKGPLCPLSGFPHLQPRGKSGTGRGGAQVDFPEVGHVLRRLKTVAEIRVVGSECKRERGGEQEKD